MFIEKRVVLKRENRGQIFMMDLIFSVVILLVALGLFYSYYYTVADNVDIYETTKNIQQGFTMTKVNSLNDDMIVEFFKDNKIKNIENSIIQQAIVFYEHGDKSDSYSLMSGYVKNFDPKKRININITLTNTTKDKIVLYNHTNKRKISIDAAEVVAINNRQVFVIYNGTSFLGPYIFEVKTWK